MAQFNALRLCLGIWVVTELNTLLPPSIFHKLLAHKINWNDSGNSTTERGIRSSFEFGETKQHPRNDYFERHLFR